MVTKEEVFSNLTIKQDAGVPFNRTNPVPLDKHSIFASKDDAVSYATLSATAYPGQVIAVNEDELTPWTAECEQLTTTVPSFELSFENNGWKVSFSNGYSTTGGIGGWSRYDSETSSWLTSGFTANDLSLCLPDQEGNLMIPMTSSETPVSVYFSRAEVNTWNLYVLDESAPNNLKKIEGGTSGGGGSSGGDVEAETARAKAAELALSNSITALTLSTDQISDAVEGILTDTLSNYQPVSSMTAYQQISDMTAYQQISGMSAYVKKDDLSNANAGGLSNVTAANPIMLSSDLSALVTKAIVLKGTVQTSAELSDKTDAKVGDMWIAADTGAEYVYANPNGKTLADKWQELGREGTIAEIARYIAELSGDNGQIAYLSNAITANAENINTLSNTTIPDLCTALSNGITANAENINTLSNTTIPAITADVGSISTDIYGDGETSGLSGKVDDLTTNVGTISTDIYTAETGLSAKVDTVSADVDQLKDDVGHISSFVSSLPADISAVSSAISTLQDNAVSVQIDGLSSTELNVLHISEADYHQLVVDGDIDPKTIYIVSADGYQNMYGERITNLSTLSTDLSSAANVSFVTAYVGDQMATVNGDVEYLSNAITAITADITAITSDIDDLSGQIGSLSGAMVSAVVISAETRAISADVKNGIATISGLSVSDLAWDISVINGGDSGYVPQTEEPVEP